MGETCKLCLKYIQGANLAILDETLLGKLEFLQMDLVSNFIYSNNLEFAPQKRSYYIPT